MGILYNIGMNKIINQIIKAQISSGEIESKVSKVQAAISRISDSRVTDQDIVTAIVEVGTKGEI